MNLSSLANPPTLLSLSGGSGAVDLLLPFNVQIQLESNWCWAAVSVSVSVYYNAGSGWFQCKLVSDEISQPSCCTNGSAPHCNIAWRLDLALVRTGNLSTWGYGTMPAADIQAQLRSNRVICCRIDWGNGNGHFVTLIGYHNDGVNEEYTIEDPLYGRTRLTATAFATAYQGMGSWSHSYQTRP